MVQRPNGSKFGDLGEPCPEVQVPWEKLFYMLDLTPSHDVL